MNVLGIIPARSKSRGIKNKNIVRLCNYPLIYYTIQETLKAKTLNRVIVSTDSPHYAKITLKYGANIPFIRPKELATDTANAIDVIIHAVLEIERLEGKKYDYVVMLQPTTPLRTAVDIDNALKKLIETGADSVISVVNVGAMHPDRMRRIVDGKLVDFMEGQKVENMPRQLLPPVYILNGAIYAVKRNILVNGRSFKGNNCRPYVMQRERSINIDDELDLLLAEAVMKRRMHQ